MMTKEISERNQPQKKTRQIKAAMAMQGISVKALAKRIGKPTNTVSIAINRIKFRPTLDKILSELGL